jgi:hypothetical protein
MAGFYKDVAPTALPKIAMGMAAEAMDEVGGINF